MQQQESAGDPLSFGQERLWFLDQLDPGDASYNIQLIRRLRGPLDVAALRLAFDDVVARHEPLRTRFPNVAGSPCAIVEPAAAVPVEWVDLSGQAAAEIDPELARLLAERTNAPFDLAAGPLLRVSLLRLGADDHVLCLVLHHIIADGWSLNILLQELEACYRARRDGRVAGLAPLPMRYADHAIRQRERADALDGALAYWRDRLAGAGPLELPADRPRPAVKTSNGAYLTRELPGALADAIDRLARARRCTPFMVLLAAYQVLLGRHSGQPDFCVGSPTAGRVVAELEPLVGYFSNVLVLRADLGDDPTFATLLGRTRATVLGALAHHEIPFERLTSELALPRDLSRDALFQTLFTMHTEDTPDRAAELPFADLTMSRVDGGHRLTKFDLMLDVWREPTRLVVVFGFNTDLFDRETVDGLARRFEVLLTGAVADPDRPISRLPLLADDEVDRLHAWGTGAVAQAPPETVLEQVARHAADAPAVVCGERLLSYVDLLAAADRLGGALRDAGVRPGSIVGVCLPRSADTVVALLGVWRAGAAYLPLDPDYPAQRLAFMVADSRAEVVITTAALAGRVPPGARGLILDGATRGATPGATPGATRGATPGAPPGLDDLAYVIYTSGSTGTPKGVAVTHRALAARARWMVRDYALTPADRVLQFASLSFDTHAEEVYPCLAAGACLVMMPDGARSLPELLASPSGRAVTVLDLPTPYWHELVDVVDTVAWPPGLRLTILGADQVHATAVGKWRDRFGNQVRLVNSYGPTETTIIATTAELGPGDDRGRPPIGRPLDNTRVYVCDAHGALVPPGVPGELLIGGAGLARGYLHRPGPTADRFVPDPYGPAGGRLYRTGDRVRWRRDGRLEFLGRLDDQVKVRGYRVEPGEVQAHLLTHPGIAQAAVVARGDALVAYVVPAGPTMPTTPTAPPADELRRHLAESLPDHLLPSAFVALERLPLTVAGKLDRQALPAPERPAGGAGFVAPRTDSEELVAAVWAEVLGLAKVGALDDFFDLGGHSLLATRVMARLQAAIDLAVPLRTLFTHRTVARFADAVEELLVAEIESLPDEAVARLLATEGAH